MSAYFVFDNIEVLNREKLETYVTMVAPVVEHYGGRYRTIGGPATVLEGDWRPTYPVIIEFDSAERARSWYDSEDYQPLKELRQSAVRCHAVLIEGT